jgi:hypothetical protein
VIGNIWRKGRKMKKNTKVFIVVISSLLLTIACDPDTGVDTVENEPAIQTDADNVSKMEANIDEKNSVVNLGTAAGSFERENALESRISTDRFLDAVGSLKAGAMLQKTSVEGDKVNAENNVYTVSMNTATGEHAVQIKEEAYAQFNRGKAVDEASLLETAHSLYTALGVVENEATVTVNTVMSALRDMESGEEIEVREEGKIIVIDREIDGIRVSGDRIAIIADVDGTVKNVVGRWSPIDYANSKFSTRLTRQEVFRRAAGVLAEKGINADTKQNLLVETHYEVVESEDGTRRLKLTGEVDLPVAAGSEMQDAVSFSIH